MKNILKLMAVAGGLGLSTVSCSNWLDVKMSDKIMETSLFSTNNGFMIALNGVYMGMVDVYGEDLSVGTIDVMAQYYNMVNGNHNLEVYANYEYGEKDFKEKSDKIWTTMYRLIANTNTLLEHCDAEGTALREDYYGMVKGEALALRAMLHFDLLRLYGPSYNDETASRITIPYRETAERDITPLLPASEVLGKVIRDLEDAAALLKDADPVFTTGVGNGVLSDDGLERADFTYRQLRLNYFAVQTLLARAYLWKGDKATAYEIATKEVIAKNQKDEEEMIFPWTTQAQVEAEEKNDLLFSSEVFFAIYHSNRSGVNTGYFSEALQTTSRLTFIGSSPVDSRLRTFYDDPDNDWRAKLAWDVVTVLQEGGDDEEEGEEGEEEEEGGGGNSSSSLFFLKFEDAGTKAELDGTETYLHMLPLIRLSEAYLIAAECAKTIDESLEYLRTVRAHRNCHMPIAAASQEEVQKLVTEEFAREVIGEGQLFFHYKRLNLTKFPDGSKMEGDYEMLPDNYVWPLPEVESGKRGTTNQ